MNKLDKTIIFIIILNLIISGVLIHFSNIMKLDINYKVNQPMGYAGLAFGVLAMLCILILLMRIFYYINNK